MVGHAALDRGIGVRIPASQPNLTLQSRYLVDEDGSRYRCAGVRTPTRRALARACQKTMSSRSDRRAVACTSNPCLPAKFDTPIEISGG